MENKVNLDGGYSAHILEDEIVFTHYNIQCLIAELSFDDLIKIHEVLTNRQIKK